MAWPDRLRPASYVAPDGTELTFQFEDVGRSVERKTAAFEFADVDGTFVQDLGRTGRRYPLRLFFSGADHDTEADAFLSALEQRGVGALNHPRYGRLDVIPFGEITQRDDLKTAANQTVIEVAFWETLRQLFPDVAATVFGSVSAGADESDTTAANQFTKKLSIKSGADRSNFSVNFQAGLEAVKSGLNSVAQTNDTIRRTFNTISRSIDESLDVLIDQPLTLAFQTIELIKTPARAAATLRARLDGYGGLVDQIFGTGTPADANALQVSDLFASVELSALCRAVAAADLTTQPEAVSAADEISARFDAWVAWRDQAATDLSITDTGEVYAGLSDLIAATVGGLVSRAFDLQTALTVVTDRPRTILDFSAEFYGSVGDDALNRLITTNNIGGDALLEIPAGTSLTVFR